MYTEPWIPNLDGTCPVDPSTQVTVLFGHNKTETGPAGGFDWRKEGFASDITHYMTKQTNPKDAIGDTKVPLWLCSPIAHAHWALGQFAGMVKYGAWNWRAAGVRSSVYISAMKRHLDAYKSGEELDPVDGSHHLGNIMACAAILLDAKAAGKLTDDRPPSVSVRPTYSFVERAMVKLRELYKDKLPRHYSIADTEFAGTPGSEHGVVLDDDQATINRRLGTEGGEA